MKYSVTDMVELNEKALAKFIQEYFATTLAKSCTKIIFARKD